MITLLNGHARLISIPKICDPRGNLSFVENVTHLPFAISRVSWIYDIPAGSGSSGECSGYPCLIIAMSGAIDMRVTSDDCNPTEIRLSDPHTGLLLDAGTERQIVGCSTNAVVMVIEGDDTTVLNLSTAVSVDDPHMRSSVDGCRILTLPREKREAGAGTVSELINGVSAPFMIRRIFYIYDVPGDSVRGGHSHFEEQCILTALSGCFDVTVADGIRTRKFSLNRPYTALYIPPGLWREMDNFSSGSVCMALSSINYRESDYVRSEEEFAQLTSAKHGTL